MKVPVYICGLLSVVCTLFLNYAESASVGVDKNSKCRNRYGYKYYYDHGTDHCEQCREICQNAKIIGTVQQCEKYCPQYLKALHCVDEEDQFYDEMLDTCSPCASLCSNHVVTGNTRVCRELCNAYLEKQTPKQVPSLHKQNHLKAVDGSDVEETSETNKLLIHPGWIASIAVGVVALVCLVVVMIVLYWTYQQQQQQQQYAPTPQRDEGEEGVVETAQRPPVEETSQGPDSSVHFAIDGATSGLPPTVPSVAFADLQDDPNHTRI